MNRALVIGISNYGWLNQNLPGCAADAAEWTAYLGTKLSLSSHAIRGLADEAATRAAILSGLQWVVENVADGDHRVVFFAGHGYRLERAPPGGGGKVVEETLVAFPGATEQPLDDFMIYDADLAAMLDAAALPASARLTLIFDSCHSGGMYRPLILGGRDPDAFDGVLPRCALMPEDQALLESSARFPRTLSALRRSLAPTAPRLLVAAARPEQSAWDDRMPDGRRHGVFSYYCVQQLIKSPGQTISEVISVVGAEIGRKYPQSPQLLGDQERFDQPIF